MLRLNSVKTHDSFKPFQQGGGSTLVPGLLRLCNNEIDQINDMVNEHINKVLSEGPSNWKELLMGEGEGMLGPFLLCEPEEHKGFLRIPRPERAGTFGSKDPHKQLPKELSAKVEHALVQWWHGCSTEHSSTAYLTLVR